MAKPRIFLSSTCYDLSTVRHELDKFLSENYGFEVLNSEKSSFGVAPKEHSHTACLEEVKEADYLILIIGGRIGGTFVGTGNSITNEEYKLAMKLDIPVMVFVDRQVYGSLITYKKDPSTDLSHIVDDSRVFDFIDFVGSGHKDNWLHKYETIEDIENVIRDQFSFYLKKYSEHIRNPKRTENAKQKLIGVPFPHNLVVPKLYSDTQEEITAFRNALFSVYSKLKLIIDSEMHDTAKFEMLRAIWVIAFHGEMDGFQNTIGIPEASFKRYAWARGKTKGVMEAMKEFGISCYYNDDETSSDVVLSIDHTVEDTANALIYYVDSMESTHGEGNGYEVFQRIDMRAFSGS